MTLLADVVAASRAIAETSARSRKTATLADLLRALERAEVAVTTGFLSGVPRQGRVGVGRSLVYAIDVEPAQTPSVTVMELDALIGDLQSATGPGSASRRRALLVAPRLSRPPGCRSSLWA